MTHLVQSIFEVSTLSMAFSFLLIYRYFEARKSEPAIVKRNYAFTYFICLFLASATSFTLLVLNHLFANIGASPTFKLFLFVPAVFLAVALASLLRIMCFLYEVMRLRAEDTADAQAEQRIKDEEEAAI
jgi:hypothetical protein